MKDWDKIERYSGFLAGQPDTSGDDDWVKAEDFDDLLASYKELQVIATEAIDVAMEECDEKCEPLGCLVTALKRRLQALLQP